MASRTSCRPSTRVRYPPLLVVTEHLAKDGSPKILERCTASPDRRRVVNRVVSDRAVFDVVEHALVLRRMSDGESVDQLRTLTGTDFSVGLDRAPDRRRGRCEGLRA